MPTSLKTSLLIALLCASLASQESAPLNAPTVSLAPVPTATITRGKPSAIDLQFRVARGFHVNSNTPSEEYLIPTALKLDVPTDIVIGKITYPPGQDTSFAFAPDQKLNVYSGDFKVSVSVRPLVGMQPGKYVIHGNLKYQACDNAACYPPKQLPVQFDFKVVKGAVAARRNPAQSPHAHKLSREWNHTNAASCGFAPHGRVRDRAPHPQVRDPGSTLHNY